MLVPNQTATCVSGLRIAFLAGAFAAAVLTTHRTPAHAAERFWEGQGFGNLWTDAFNWFLLTPPGFAVGDTVSFTDNLAGPGLTNVDVNANQAVDSITFQSDLNYILSGDSFLTLQGTGEIVRSLADPAGSAVHFIFNKINLQSDGAWRVEPGASLEVSGAISNIHGGLVHSLTKTGAGRLRLNGNNTYGGGTVVSQGTLSVAPYALPAANGVVNNATLEFNHFLAGTYAGNISGTGKVVKSGSATVTLAGNSTYTGSTDIVEGTLVLTHPNALGLGTVTLGTEFFDTALLLGAPGVVNNNIVASFFNISDTIIGTTNFDPGPANSEFAGQLTLNSFIVLQAGSTDRTTFSGLITGTGGLVINSPFGPGRRIVINRPSGVANNFTEDVYIFEDAHLQLGVANSIGNRTIPDAAEIWFLNAGSSLRLAPTGSGDSETVGTLFSNGSGAGVVDMFTGTAFTLSIGADGKSGTFSGTITDSAGALTINKVGAGTQTLSGINTYSGGTKVSAGKLVVSTNSLPAAGGVVNNAILEFNQVASNTYAGVISGTGQLIKSGGGALTLNQTNTHTGGTRIEAGTLVVGTNSLPAAGGIINNANLEFSQDTNGTYSGVVSGSGRLVKARNFTLTLTNNNTYTGGTTVSGGTLVVNTNSLPAAGGVVNNVNLEFNQTANGTYAGVISGIGNVTKSGGGTLTLDQTNTHTGGTRIEAGTLAVSTNANLGANSATVTFAGGTLRVSSLAAELQFPTARAFVAANANAVFDITSGTNQTIVDGLISGNGGLIKNGPGGLMLRNTAATYTGPTIVNQGNLVTNSPERLPDNTDVTLNNGTNWITFGGAETFDALNGSGGVVFAFGPDINLTLGAANGSGTYEGSISQAGGGVGQLTKIGTGTQTLTGNNAYTGGTTVDDGKLVVNTNSLPASNGVANNATLEFNQTLNGTYAGVISGTGTVLKQGGGTLTLNQTNTNTGPIHVQDGTLTIASGATPSAATEILNGATLRIEGGAFNANGPVDVNGGSLERVSGGFNLAPGNTLTANNNAQVSFNGLYNITSNNTFTLNSGSDMVSDDFIQIGIGGAGTLNVSGGSTVTSVGADVAGTANSTGSITITDADSQWLMSGPLFFGTDTNAVGTIDINNQGHMTTGRAVIGTGGGTAMATVTVTGADSSWTNQGNLVLGQSGAIVVNGGTFQTNTLSGDAVATVNISDPSGGGAPALTIGTNNGSSTFNGTIADAAGGPGGLTKTGTGTFTLTAANTHTGGTRIEDGVLEVSANANLGANSSPVTFAGGTLRATGTSQVSLPAARSIITSDADAIFDSQITGALLDIQSPISGNGGLVKNGPAGMNIRNNVSTYSGSTTVNQGQLGLFGTVSEILPSTTDVTVNGGTFLLWQDITQTIGSLSGNATVGLHNNGAHLRVGQNDTDSTFTGIINSTGTGVGGMLTKIGTGTLTLTGANTYPGGTVVEGGTLLANNTTGSATGTGPVTVMKLATLGGTGFVAGTTTVHSGGTVAPGASVGALGLGAAVFETDSRLAVELAGSGGAAGTDFDQVNVTAGVSLGGTLDIVLASGFMPEYFDEFNILTAATRTGEFNAITGAFINSNMTLAPIYDHNGTIGLTLVAAIPGDANLDGTVNGLDLLRWQANLFSGDKWDQGDFNLDGLVNGLDLLIWQSHLFNSVPTPSPLAASAPTVPEPGTLGVIVLGMLGLAKRRHAVA